MGGKQLVDDVRTLLERAIGRHQAGDFAAAETLYRRVLQEDANNYDARYLLGTALLQMGRFSDCVELLQSVVAARPDMPDAHNNLGIAYKAQGKWESAARAFQAAIKANPDYSQALFNLGSVMEQRGLSADAEKCYRHALELDADDIPTQYSLANVLCSQQKWQEAEACYRELATRDPENLDLRVHVGFVLVRQKRFDEAVELFQQVLADKPDYHEIHNNLSYVYERVGRFDEAVAAARRAIELQPEYAEGCNNLGTALKSLRRLDEACDCFRQALQLQPDFPLAEFNLGTTLLLEGDLKAGWPGYDRRGETLEIRPADYGKPRWDGSSLNGKTILLYAEQGFGDVIQFIRYAAVVKELGGSVIVHCPKRLTALLSSYQCIDQLIVEGDQLPNFDVEAPLLSLPRILSTTLDSIPADIPYIFADTKLVDQWKLKRNEITGYQIGICWQGNSDYPRDAQRSPPLEHFAALAGVPGVSLVSLQKGEGTEQLGEAAFDVETFGDDFDGSAGAFMDTAAVMISLDLVVTSDTATAHLAGALGVPVWVALPYLPDWRWLLDRDDSPWSPTMRLFRQPALDDWNGAFTEIAAACGLAVSHSESA